MSPTRSLHRPRAKALGLPELVAIALGGMVGGGIFTILGVSVSLIGVWTPLAIGLGAVMALLAAYSYVKLGVYYRDEGATYAFFRRTYPSSPFAASLIGWWVIFGYVSTIALYAWTFASYAIGGLGLPDGIGARRGLAIGVIACFTAVNLWSVRGMGRIEDAMVYTKLAILVLISFVLIDHGTASWPTLSAETGPVDPLSIAIVTALTFVAYEGFQLVINAVEEMDEPERKIPRAIYTAVLLAALIYGILAFGALRAIPMQDIIRNREFALAAGAGSVLGRAGILLVVAGALLATSSAISGTVFGASRQLAVIAVDGHAPALLGRRRNRIPVHAILAMSGSASALILAGTLELILEFGSLTFLLVSLLMALANHRIRAQTGSSPWATSAAIAGLLSGTALILRYELRHRPEQVAFIAGLYALLTLGAWFYARPRSTRVAGS
ncbi:MAG: APC family permease [Myxococcota bacterium]